MSFTLCHRSVASSHRFVQIFASRSAIVYKNNEPQIHSIRNECIKNRHLLFNVNPSNPKLNQCPSQIIQRHFSVASEVKQAESNLNKIVDEISFNSPKEMHQFLMQSKNFDQMIHQILKVVIPTEKQFMINVLANDVTNVECLMTHLFQMFNYDHRSSVSVSRMQQGLKFFIDDQKEAISRWMFHSYDKDQSGGLSFDEFSTACKIYLT